MVKISLMSLNHWSTNFCTDDAEINHSKHQHCEYCEFGLDRSYCFIIDNLKEAGLLVEGYKKICCYCYLLKGVGLFYLRSYLISVLYDNELDILNIYFEEDKSRFSVSDERVCFVIHDYSKWYEKGRK